MFSYILGVIASWIMLPIFYNYNKEKIKEKMAQKLYNDTYENYSIVIDLEYKKMLVISTFCFSLFSWSNFVVLIYYIIKKIRTGSMI